MLISLPTVWSYLRTAFDMSSSPHNWESTWPGEADDGEEGLSLPAMESSQEGLALPTPRCTLEFIQDGKDGHQLYPCLS